MFQVNFSEQSMHELNQLDTRSQMLLVEVISSLTQEQLDHPDEELGRFQRNGRTYYRVRAGEFRIYFEPQDGESLYAPLHPTPQYLRGFCLSLQIAGHRGLPRRTA